MTSIPTLVKALFNLSWGLGDTCLQSLSNSPDTMLPGSCSHYWADSQNPRPWDRVLVVVDTHTSVKPNLSQYRVEPMASLWVPAAQGNRPFPRRCCMPTIMPRLPIPCFPPSSASVILPLQAQRVSSSHPWPRQLCYRLQDHSLCCADLMLAFTYKPQLCLVSTFSLFVGLVSELC